jgi:endonuclease YncB( thermonuclease family)/predicted aspartyl protease
MILRDGSNRVNSTCLIIFIFIAALLSGCSGCSKSGLMSAKNENKALHADSAYDNQSQTEESGNSTAIKKSIDDGIKSVWMEINGIRLPSIFDMAAASLYISASDASALINRGILQKQDSLDVHNFRDPDGSISAGTRINLRSVKIDDSILTDIDAIVIDDKLTNLLLRQPEFENSEQDSTDNESTGNKIDLTGNDISGKVISIIDGDTYDILVEGNKTIRIRMEGIDAPEKGMPFYQVSKNHLGKLCFNKIVKVHITGADEYNRYIGFTYLEDGTELSHKMIEAGYAWHFKKYNSDSDLSGLEIKARNSKSGLWVVDNQLPPWAVRTLHNKGISTKNLFNIKEGQN